MADEIREQVVATWLDWKGLGKRASQTVCSGGRGRRVEEIGQIQERKSGIERNLTGTARCREMDRPVTHRDRPGMEMEPAATSIEHQAIDRCD